MSGLSSLFVTLAYAMDVAGYRKKPLYTPTLRIKAAPEAADEDVFSQLRGMAAVDPSHRATAADILDSVFKGQGRTTRRHPARAAAGVSEQHTGPAQPGTHQPRRSMEPKNEEKPEDPPS